MTCAELMREFKASRPDGWTPMVTMRLVDLPDDSDLAMHPELLRVMRALGFTDQQCWEPTNFFRAMDLMSDNWTFASRLEGCGSDESITRIIGLRLTDPSVMVTVPPGFTPYISTPGVRDDHPLAEGELYSTAEPFGVDSVGYGYTVAGHFVTCILTRLDYPNMRLARRGKLSLGIYSDRDVVMFTYRIPKLVDGDIQYTIHLAPSFHRDLPPTDDTRLTVVFVHAENHRIAVIRRGTISGEFAATVHDALRVQSELKWDPSRYRRHVEALYDRCPRTKDLEALCSVRCEM